MLNPLQYHYYSGSTLPTWCTTLRVYFLFLLFTLYTFILLYGRGLAVLIDVHKLQKYEITFKGWHRTNLLVVMHVFG